MKIYSNDLIDNKEHIFKKIYTSNLYKVVYFAQSYLGNRQEAESIAQEVFITLWEKMDELDLEKDILPYLLVLIRNKCLNVLKSKKDKYVRYSSLQAEKNIINYISLESADSAILAEELNMVMNNALGMMSRPVKRAFLLNRNKNLKYEEIAKLEGVSVKTIEYRIMSALRIFRQNYKNFLKV